MAGVVVQIHFICSDAGGRTTPVIISPSYRPHFRVGTGEHLGVVFVGGSSDSVSPGCTTQAEAKFAYAPAVNYDALKDGVQFQVLEGNRIVGIGVVTRITQ
jgi:translation elongation factor EF-Tu-like GTPase